MNRVYLKEENSAFTLTFCFPKLLLLLFLFFQLYFLLTEPSQAGIPTRCQELTPENSKTKNKKKEEQLPNPDESLAMHRIRCMLVHRQTKKTVLVILGLFMFFFFVLFFLRFWCSKHLQASRENKENVFMREPCSRFLKLHMNWKIKMINIAYSLLLSAFGSKHGSESVCLIHYMHVSEAGGNFQIFLFFAISFWIIIGPHFPLQREILKKIVTSFWKHDLLSWNETSFIEHVFKVSNVACVSG